MIKHASGHAKQDELKLLFRLFKPEYFMPVHGEYRMLKSAVDLASECGIDKDHSFICRNGDMIAISKNGIC